MASTSSQTPSTPTSFSNPKDVFLSFRGIDTRRGFTGHLYSALDRYNIRTFMDDPELQCGEAISATLLQAIQESKIYIVVFSENYASSSWCLDELVEILNCSKTMQRLIIPVFYKVLPDIVQYQTGSFEEHFRKHEIRFADQIQKVKDWRRTLKEVANLSGKHIDEKRSEADIVNEIIDEILLQIKPAAVDVARYPVGLKSRVKDITALLTSGTKGIIKIGIYGMGGVGKTTLAKALFNELLLEGFKGSCFLANVRENGKLKGLESLQQQLLNDVLRSKNKVEVSSVGRGTQMIEDRICSEKILVVIDDLDDHKEFKSLVGPFATGSVVIITTRDEETLVSIAVEAQYRYRVNELGDAESETLFFRHAFGDTKPDNTLLILSKDILSLAGGLPLALEVFGSCLYKKSEVKWKSYIETLQRNPNSTIQQRLLISLDALESDDPLLKKMFLDIACFFVGRKKEKVVEILDTYYPYADDKIDILMKKCLLTINHDNEFRMHDLLQDMGKKIARNNSPDVPGKHSRLWVPIEICEVLEEHEGTEAIEGIVLRRFKRKDPFNEVSFAVETLKRMSKLRFLCINDINLTGNFKRTVEDLRWFRWSCCPLKCLPVDFYPKKLVILELPYSKTITMWEANMVLNAFEKLKTLNMSFSEDLITTPDFRRLPCLENLFLEGCRSLKEVHISIGSLERLVTLNLKGCVNLRSLPDTICNLRAVEVLCIEECTRLEALPRQLGNIESLTELNACGLNVQKLPDSIGYLKKLVKLKLDYSKKLKSLPNTICNLRALEVLSIKNCTNLKALPIQLGNIKSLTELNARGLSVKKLPDSIGDLIKLVKLKLDSDWKLEYLPNTICNLRALEVLSISDCTNLEALPDELGKIESLRVLNAASLDVSKLPDSIGDLSKLVTLKLNNNWKLKSIPNTICNLRALEVLSIEYCANVEALPVELGNIESLREFRARGITVSKLPDSICNMRSLEILDITFCHKLQRLPDQLWRLTRLSSLDVNGVTLLNKLPDIESSQSSLSLAVLKLCGSKITALPSGITQLSNLKELDVQGCDHILSIAELPPNLSYINASYCTSMKRLNLSNLKLLQKLDLQHCSSLLKILGLEELTSVNQMILRGCDSCLDVLPEPLVEIYSGFEQEIVVYLESWQFPEWIRSSSVLRLVFNGIEILDGSSPSNVNASDLAKEISYGSSPSDVNVSSVNLQPNLSDNYLGMILCFKMWDETDDILDYSVRISPSDILWSHHQRICGSSIVIVPRTMFRVTGTDHTIKFTSNARVQWIRLLYKNEDDITTVNDEDLNVEGGYPFKRLKVSE